MQKNKIFTKIIPSIILLFVVIFGIKMYQGIILDKQISEVNLSTFIPQDASQVLQVNRVRQIESLKPFVAEIQPNIDRFQHTFLFPYYVVKDNASSLLLAKLNMGKTQKMRAEMQTMYPSFPPQKLKYKDAEFLFYTASNTQFFVCMFYKGIFAGSYNPNLLKKIVDTSSAKNFFSTPTMRLLQTKMRASYFANFYTQNSHENSAYNVHLNDSVIHLSGYLLEKENAPKVVSDSSIVCDSILPPFPTGTIALEMSRQSMSDQYLLNSHFSPVLYRFHTATATIDCRKFKGDRFDIYKLFNGEEKHFSNENLIRNFYEKHAMYYGSRMFSEKIFGKDQRIYFAFKDDLFLYTSDKGALIDYLLDEKEILHPPFESMAEVNSICYTRNVNAFSPNYLSDGYKSIVSDSTVLIQMKQSDQFMAVDLDFGFEKSKP